MKSVEELGDDNNNNSSSKNNNITTATEVAFFPRYSVVNKSWREEKAKKKIVSKEKSQSKVTEKEKSKEESKSHLDKSVRGGKENLNSTKQSLYEIISTMRFKTQQKDSAMKTPAAQQTSR